VAAVAVHMFALARVVCSRSSCSYSPCRCRGWCGGPGFEADDDAVPNFFIEGLGWSAYAPD